MNLRAKPIAWCVGLALSHLGLVSAGAALPTPPGPWSPADLASWLTTTEPHVAAFSLVRVVALVITWYLAAVTGTALLGQVRGLHPLGVLADRVSGPTVRQLVHHMVGAGLTLSIAGGSVFSFGAITASAAVPAPTTAFTTIMTDVPSGPPGEHHITMQIIPAPDTDPPSPPVDVGPPGVPSTLRMTVIDDLAPTTTITAITANRPASSTVAPTERTEPKEPTEPTGAAPTTTVTTLAPTTTAEPPDSPLPRVEPPTTIAAASTGPTGPTGPDAPNLSIPMPRTETTSTTSAPATPTSTSTSTSPTPLSPAVAVPPTTSFVTMRMLTPTTTPLDVAAAAPTEPDRVAGPGVFPTASTASGPVATWTIQPGDHLWHVAESTLQTALGRPASTTATITYLGLLIDHNRGALAVPDNPDLVFPGQVFVLPAVPADLRAA